MINRSVLKSKNHNKLYLIISGLIILVVGIVFLILFNGIGIDELSLTKTNCLPLNTNQNICNSDEFKSGGICYQKSLSECVSVIQNKINNIMVKFLLERSR